MEQQEELPVVIPTHGSKSSEKMAIAHNGNLSNSLELRDKLELSGAIFNTTSDTETIKLMLLQEKDLRFPVEEAVSKAMNSLEGAYSLVLMSSTKLIAARSHMDSDRYAMER